MNYPPSDHFDGKVFFNPGVRINNNLWRLLKWQKGRRKNPWPKNVPVAGVPLIASAVHVGELYATFINHATYLLQFSELNVLTDPVFSQRVGPLPGIGVRRVSEPGIPFTKLPPIDLVVVSHNHYDHFDLSSLRKLYRAYDPIFAVPLGNGGSIRKFGSQKVRELDWYETEKLSGGGEVMLVPVQHWSGRAIHDRYKALWGGFVIRVGAVKSFFAGDTGYGPHFKAIQKKWGGFDLCLLPIGAYEPRWFMHPQHMDPKDAVQAHIDLASKNSLAMHYGTFHLADEGHADPPRVLKEVMAEHPELAPNSFRAPAHGQTFYFKNV